MYFGWVFLIGTLMNSNGSPNHIAQHQPKHNRISPKIAAIRAITPTLAQFQTGSNSRMLISFPTFALPDSSKGTVTIHTQTIQEENLLTMGIHVALNPWTNLYIPTGTAKSTLPLRHTFYRFGSIIDSSCSF